MTPGQRAVDLLEHLEDCGLLALGDADSRVPDSEVQQNLVLGLALPLHVQHHFAFLSELQRVAHQIENDLSQAVVVANHHVGHVEMDIERQFQSQPIGADGKQFHGVSETLAQVERLVVQHELSGLDLGEVQDIVDDRQQSFARFPDRGEKIALP